MPTIALVTCARFPALADDEHPLIDSLAAVAVRAAPAVWDDATVDWEEFDGVVIRSCWDYHLRPAEFFAWVARVDRLGVAMWNPPPVLRWNARKTYLRELAAAGVRTVPTVWVEGRGDVAAMPTLAAILDDAGWDHAVVKPVVSSSAHETWRVSLAEARRDATHDRRLRALAAGHGAMVQPVVNEIVADGEWSLLFLGGAFSHAVIKHVAPGEFRVQREFGGTFQCVRPTTAMLRQAERAIRVAPGEVLYARVDGVMVDGDLVVTELELLEPSLFLDADPGAPGRLAAAIEVALGHE
jgi:hypothetical protein